MRKFYDVIKDGKGGEPPQQQTDSLGVDEAANGGKNFYMFMREAICNKADELKKRWGNDNEESYKLIFALSIIEGLVPIADFTIPADGWTHIFKDEASFLVFLKYEQTFIKRKRLPKEDWTIFDRAIESLSEQERNEITQLVQENDTAITTIEQIEKILPKDFHPNTILPARIMNLWNYYEAEVNKYNSLLQSTQPTSEALKGEATPDPSYINAIINDPASDTDKIQRLQIYLDTFANLPKY